jgi:hypothetical protein
LVKAHPRGGPRSAAARRAARISELPLTRENARTNPKAAAAKRLLWGQAETMAVYKKYSLQNTPLTIDVKENGGPYNLKLEK